MLDFPQHFNGPIMRPLTLLGIFLLSLFALAACGKKGNLYLPDAPTQSQSTQSAK